MKDLISHSNVTTIQRSILQSKKNMVVGLPNPEDGVNNVLRNGGDYSPKIHGVIYQKI